MPHTYGIRPHPTGRNKLLSLGLVAWGVLLLLAGACDTEDAFTKSKREQAERNCAQEQELNMVPGESHGQCVKRWMILLGD
jgi:hypothetical protein